MLLDLLILGAKIVAGLIGSILLILIFHHIRAQLKIRRFQSLGIFNHPGNSSLFIGVISKFGKYDEEAKESPNEALPHPFRYLMENIDDQKTRGLDGAKFPAIIVNFLSKVWIVNNDPEIASELFNKHGKYIDKVPDQAEQFKNLLGSSLLFGPTDDDWRAKRKACAHAFYKDRLNHMLEVLKGKINLRVDKWTKEIESGKTGSTEINIAKEFEEIFAHNLIHIAFGESMLDSTVEINYLTDKTKRTTERRAVPIGEALTNTFALINVSLMARMEDPITLLAMFLFGKELDRHPMC